MRKIVISDIHGCARSFQALLEDQVRLQPEDKLFLLGDYFSRGPDAAGVLAYISMLAARGQQLVCLMGNHEHRMLLRQKAGQIVIPSIYRKFISSLQVYHQEDHYLMIHAGLDCSLPNPMVG
ncbi:MAG: metallophosphoesterase, partial [Bacteroidota bacterium]